MTKPNLYEMFKFTIDKANEGNPAEYQLHSQVFWVECEEQDGRQEDPFVSCLRELEAVMVHSVHLLGKEDLKELGKHLKKAAKVINDA